MNNERYDPTYKIIGAIYEVYNHLGPGLLESVYEIALAHELRNLGFSVDCQVPLELKSVEKIDNVHHKQLLTYLKLTNKKIGLLVNFGDANIKHGITRIVNKF